MDEVDRDGFSDTAIMKYVDALGEETEMGGNNQGRKFCILCERSESLKEDTLCFTGILRRGRQF
jgi:hypothetical protein